MTLLELLKSGTVTIPACQSAEGHAKAMKRLDSNVTPWECGRKRPKRKPKPVVDNKIASVYDILIKRSFNYTDLGSRASGMGTSAFNPVAANAFNSIVQSGLQTLPYSNTLGNVRSTMDSVAPKPVAPKKPGFWSNLFHGNVDAAFEDTAGKFNEMPAWKKPLYAAEMAANATPLGPARWGQAATWGLSGAASAANEAGADESGPNITNKGPGFFQSAATIPLIPAYMAKTDRISADAKRRNREAMETNPTQRRINTFNRWKQETDPEVFSANMPDMFPDLWRRYQAGEQF